MNLSRLEPQDRPLHQPGRQTTQFLSTRLLSIRRLLRGARVVAAPVLALVVLAALPLDVALSVNTAPPVEATAVTAAAEFIAVTDIAIVEITRAAAMSGLERPAIDRQRSRRVVGRVGHRWVVRARLIKRRITVSAAARLR